MRAVLILITLLSVSACALWQLLVRDPVLFPAGLGLLLLIMGLIAGLSMATDSATRFIRDVSRLNRYLADQNNDLAEMNLTLLKKTSPEKQSQDS